MQSYEGLIMESLGEGTPREKYERLKKMIEFLEALAYPRRGTWEEDMAIQTAANHSAKILDELKSDDQ
jgi:hypothetical protein